MKIVIAGAGFGGLRAALRLADALKDREEHEIILVNDKSYHTYTPSLYEIASAYSGKLEPTEEQTRDFKEYLDGAVCFPIRDIIAGRPITFVEDRVVEIDGENNVFVLEKGDRIYFDYGVLSVGSAVTYFGVEGASVCCSALKTVGDALRIRDHLRRVMARVIHDGAQARIAVIGAGLSGFEVVTEIASFVRRVEKEAEDVSGSVSIELIEAGDAILSATPEPMQKKAAKRLAQLGVTVKTNARIVKAEPKKLHFEDGSSAHADLIVWGGGIQGAPVLQTFKGARFDKAKRIIVDAFLRVEGFDNIFSIGDSTAYYDSKQDMHAPATAWAAEQEADIAADNILARLEGKELKPLSLAFPGFVSSAGGRYGIAYLYGMTFAGPFAWLIKRLIDLKYLLSIYPPLRAAAIWLRATRLFSRNDY